ncbi:hypothetical protein [Shewanella phage FishSpeaker]|nr:hypothetical protein [Shewanella phage FishSpeaker]
MSIVKDNSVKKIQSALAECELYKSKIDGAWGGGSTTAFTTLVRGMSDSVEIQFTDVKDDNAVICDVQRVLKGIGLYQGAVDGAWGKGCVNAMDNLVNHYKRNHGLPTYDLPWSKSVSPEFINQIYVLAREHGYSYEWTQWLMSCMHFETGGTFSSTIQNGAGAKYFGLIQFGTAAASDLGTTVEELTKLTPVEQLHWVFAYFNLWRKRGKTYTQLEDLYLTIFYPAAVGKNADTVIFLKDTVGYRQNNGFDFDKNGEITVGEICDRIYKVHFDGLLPINRRVQKGVTWN